MAAVVGGRSNLIRKRMSANPTSKAGKTLISGEKRKKDGEKDRTKLKQKVPPDAKKRFGREFQMNLCEHFLSEDPNAIGELRKMHSEILAYYNEHNLTELWLSDDEGEKDSKASIQQKLNRSIKSDDRSPSTSKLKQVSNEKGECKSDDEVSEGLKIATTPVFPVTPPTASSSIVPQNVLFELSDDSSDEVITTVSSSTNEEILTKKLPKPKDISSNPSSTWAQFAKRIKKSSSASGIDSSSTSVSSSKQSLTNVNVKSTGKGKK